jgi:tetratricopeptide (TPR) repeat protein
MEFGERIVGDLAETDASATDDALRTLQRAELVRARDGEGAERTMVFRHPLIHEVAYGSLLTSTRRAMHGRVGTWLEEHGGEDRVAELARHFDHSDDRDKARRYLQAAGERAHALNANHEAFEWLMAAADAWGDEPDRRGDLLEAAAQDVYLVSGTARAAEIQRDAISLHELAGNDRAASRARIWLGRYEWLLGDPDEAELQNSLAIEGLERHGPSPDLALAYSFRAQSLMLIPDFDDGEYWARQAIEVAEATDAPMVLAHAYNNLGTCILGRGDALGIEYLRRSEELALEHNLPDEVGRARNNLANQGSRVFPLPYAEMDAFLAEGADWAARTIPDGIFDRWIRAAWGEFLFVSGRWQEAEDVLWKLEENGAEAYLKGVIVSLRAHLYAHRGRYDEAAEMFAGMTEAALRVGDLQAVIPAFGTEAAIKIGLEDGAGAVAAWRRAIDRRGEIQENLLSVWLAFEAADGLSAMVVRDPASPALRDGLELLASFARTIAPDVALPGNLVFVEVRQVLFGAAIEQLRVVARGVGASVDLPDGSGRLAALPVLDREHRTFDAARIRLWLAEEGDASELATASAVFRELSAHPFVERAHRAEAR